MYGTSKSLGSFVFSSHPPRRRRAARLPTLAQVDLMLAGSAIASASVEDAALNHLALALTAARGRRIAIAPDARALVEELFDGAVRLEVRTDCSFHTSPSSVPNVYVQVYRRKRGVLLEVARRSSGRGLLEGGDLRPELAELLLYAVAQRRPQKLRRA